MDVRQILVLTLAWTVAGLAHAQVFKCHDDQGQLVFSSFPCGDSIERVPVSVGSGDQAPAAESPQTAQQPNVPPPADAEFQSAGTAAYAEMDIQSLSPEQIELLQMHQQLQRQSDQRAQEIADSERQVLMGEALGGSATAYSSPQTTGQNDDGNAACESAKAALDSYREQGRRGYSASQSRSHKARMRQAKDRVRNACRPR